MKKLLIALSLMMLVIPATVMAAGFPNPGFEWGFGGNGVANGWTAYTMNWLPGNPVFASSDIARSGAFSQSVTNDGEGGVFAQMNTKANFDYTVSVWVNASRVEGCYFAVDWTGGTDANAVAWDAWTFNTIENDWQQLTVTGTATSNNITVYLDVYGATVRFDDVTPGAVPEPASLLTLGTGLIGLVGMIRRRK